MSETVKTFAITTIGLILFFTICIRCSVKEKPQTVVAPQGSVSDNVLEEDEGETQCVYLKTDKRTDNTFPFNKSDRIELVSYQWRKTGINDQELIKDGHFSVANIEQRVTLSKIQRDSLFSILFNFKKVRQGNVEVVADCYNPRNSVVFYENGRAIAFLEICFECSQTLSTMDVDFGEYCDEKWCALQKFFKNNKVDYELIHQMCL